MQRAKDNFKNKIILVLCLLALLFVSLFTLTANFSYAKVKEDEKLLPSSNAEYLDGLLSPIACATDGENYAIIKDSHTIVYYLSSNDEYKEIEGFLSLGQIAITNLKGVNELWFSDNGSIYHVPLTSLSNFKIADLENYKLTGGNFFSVNDSHLISVFKINGQILSKNNLTKAEDTLEGNVDGEKPVAINSKNDIFYFFDNQIVINTINTIPLKENQVFSTLTPTSMVASDTHLFVLAGYDIYKIEIATKVQTKLSFNVLDDYDLGSCQKPKSLSLKGENLLITDSEGSIQEFTIDEDKLTFTGFAIAKGKTAFNRISGDAVNVERYGDNTAVLDSTKLTVIKQSESFDAYDRASYLNLDKKYFENAIEDKPINELPNKFALGLDQLVLTFTDNRVLKVNVRNGKATELTSVKSDETIKDIAYQSGSFYLLTTSNNAQGTAVYNVYSLTEDGSEFTPLFPSAIGYAEKITADVFKNIYVSTGTNVNLHTKNSNYARTSHSTLSGATKLCTDLGGNLFALANGNLYYYDTEWVKITSNLVKTVSAFSLNFDKKEITLLTSGEEIIYLDKTQANASITEVSIPTNLKTTDRNADLSNLNFYKLKNDTANVYQVGLDGEFFDYQGLYPTNEEYVYLGKVEKQGLSPEMLILLGKDRAFLVNAKECVKFTKQISQASESKFIATGVYLYYLPVITKNDTFVLTDTKGVRLNKGDVVQVKNQFEFLDRSYYFVETNKNGKTYLGYIPKNFTADILSEAYTSYTFTIEKVKETTLYAEESLTTALFELTKDTQVKVLEKGVATLKVAYNTGDNWVVGYISSNAIVNYHARNITAIIIIATIFVVASLSIIILKFRKIR